MVLGKDLKLLIFDFDGTLHDIEIDWARAKQLAEVAEGETLGEAINRHKQENNQMPLVKLAQLEAEALDGQKLSPETSLVLTGLSTKYKIAVFSRNSSQAITALLNRSGFSPDMVVGRDEVDKIKPDPEGLKTILRHFQVSPEESLMIGDTWHDAEVAKAAGIKSAIIGQENDSRFQPDYRIGSIAELKSL